MDPQSESNYRGTGCGKAARPGLKGSGEATNRSTWKSKMISGFIAFCIISSVTGQLKADGDTQKEIISIPVEVVKDKIRGGLLGQILGNLNGLPHEMRYIDAPGDVKNYVPSLPNGAWTDDDTDFEWFYICEMQKNRNAFLSADVISELWKERVNRGVWCSNRFARYLMDLGIKPPHTGYSTFNPWAGFISRVSFYVKHTAL